MLNTNEEILDAYKQKAKAQIKEMKAKMQIFEAHAEKTTADIRIKNQRNLKDWKSRFKDIEERLDTLSDATEGAWKEIRSGIDAAMKELSDAIDTAFKN